MESGDRRIDSEFLVRVADYFGVSIAKMLNRSLEVARDSHQTQSEGEIGIKEALKYILENYNRAKNASLKNIQ